MKKCKNFTIILLCTIVFLISQFLSFGGSFNWVSPLNAAAYNFTGMAYGHNKFICVTSTGEFFESEDSYNWKQTESMNNTYLSNISFLNGNFIALGNTIAVSGDGSSWSRSLTVSNNLYGVAYGQNKYIAVGSSGKIFVSRDTSDWTSVTTGTIETLRAVSYGNDSFIAVGDNGTVLSSTDGTTWSKSTIEQKPTLCSIVFATGKFTAAGMNGAIYQSDDGAVWHAAQNNDTSIINSIIYANNTYYAAGGNITGNGKGILLHSYDGLSWKKSFLDDTLNSIAFSPEKFAACGNNGVLCYSDDFYNWEYFKKATTTFDLYDITFAKDSFYAVGKYGTLLSSIDGYDWTKYRNVTSKNIYSICFEDGVLIAGSEKGLIFTSTDLKTFSPIKTVSKDNIYKIFHANDTFFALTPSETLLSKDTNTWTSLSHVASGAFYANGKYILMCSDYYMTSKNAANWIKFRYNNENIMDVAFGNNVFVSYSKKKGLFVSDSKMQWKKTYSIDNVKNVIFRNGRFFVITGAGRILTSINGEIWLDEDVWTTGSSVAWGINRLVSVGSSGRVFIGTKNQDYIKIFVNGKEVSTDMYPEILNNRTFVPARTTFEALNATVSWNSEKGTVIISKENLKIYLYPGLNKVTVNGETLTLPDAPYISNGRLMVPLRFIAESLGASVTFESDSNLIAINM